MFYFDFSIYFFTKRRFFPNQKHYLFIILSLFGFYKWRNVSFEKNPSTENIFFSVLEPLLPRPADNCDKSQRRWKNWGFFIVFYKTKRVIFQYTLIPRASVSLKIIHELGMFFIFIYQHHKQTMMSDVSFVIFFWDFCCIILNWALEITEKLKK